MKKKGITWFLQGKRTAQRITACKENRKRNKRKENIKGTTEKEKYQTQSKWHKGNAQFTYLQCIAWILCFSSLFRSLCA